MFQDGRPLIYDTGDYQAGIEKLKKLIDWDGFPEYQRKLAPKVVRSESVSVRTSREPDPDPTRVRTSWSRRPERSRPQQA